MSPPPPGEADELDDPPRPLVDHLEELRERLIAALLGWGAATIAAYAFYPRLLRLLLRPPVEKLVYTSPIEPFFAQIKVSLVAGVLLAFPWILYQAGKFISIGLRRRERELLFKLIPVAYFLFLLGGGVGLFLIGPAGLRFLMSYSTDTLVPYITLNAYLSYLSYLTLGLAIMFQLPIVLFVLASLGALELSTLTRYRRHAFILILIVGAAVTPGPDVFTQVMVALPTYLLYELSILAVRLSGRGAVEPPEGTVARENSGML